MLFCLLLGKIVVLLLLFSLAVLCHVAQNINGVSATEFETNTIAIAAWKATVAKACSPDNPDLIRVDIISMESVARRALWALAELGLGQSLSHNLGQSLGMNPDLRQSSPAESPPREQDNSQEHMLHDNKHALAAVVINFEVSFTLQDFKTSNVNVTTNTLKANYQTSVADQTFSTNFASEIVKRTNNTEESQELIEKIQPAEVVLAENFKVVQTTDHPTYRPSASPTTCK